MPQVKQAREELQSDFTNKDKLLDGGGISTHSAKQIASNQQNPQSQLEKQIFGELSRQGLQSEKDLVSKEMRALD